MKIKFISLASGSSGNCYFIGTDAYGILVDAGIGIRTIKKHLKDLVLDLIGFELFLLPMIMPITLKQ